MVNDELILIYRQRRSTHPLTLSDFTEVADAWREERWRYITQGVGFVVTSRNGLVVKGYFLP